MFAEFYEYARKKNIFFSDRGSGKILLDLLFQALCLLIGWASNPMVTLCFAQALDRLTRQCRNISADVDIYKRWFGYAYFILNGEATEVVEP